LVLCLLVRNLVWHNMCPTYVCPTCVPCHILFQRLYLIGYNGFCFVLSCSAFQLQLTMWDLRVKENGGCVHRISGTPGDTLYSVCSSSTGNIAVGGVDRTVTIYDPRRLASVIILWIILQKVMSAIMTCHYFVNLYTYLTYVNMVYAYD